MKTETQTNQIPGIPEGYRPVRFGKPLKDEQFVGADGRIRTANSDFLCNYLIVEPIPEDPLPEGTRLVTDEERRAKKKPARYWYEGYWFEGVISDVTVWWAMAGQYAIPIDTVLEDVEPISEQHPEGYEELKSMPMADRDNMVEHFVKINELVETVNGLSARIAELENPL